MPVATRPPPRQTVAMTDDVHLASRHGLPPEFLALRQDYPRETWPDHPGFHGLVSFWLDRHMGFRLLTDRIRDAALALALGDADTDPGTFALRLVPLGRRLVDDLIGHHQIEDEAYFPELAALEPRLSRGIDILDADRHDLDRLLDGFVTDANILLQSPDPRNAAGRFLERLAPFTTLLNRHLTDEEDLILPIILKHRYG